MLGVLWHQTFESKLPVAQSPTAIIACRIEIEVE